MEHKDRKQNEKIVYCRVSKLHKFQPHPGWSVDRYMPKDKKEVVIVLVKDGIEVENEEQKSVQ